jgi:Mg2+-importing ATPase
MGVTAEKSKVDISQIRLHENKHLEKASKADVDSLLWSLNTTELGLSKKQIEASRCQNGLNILTKEDKKSNFVLCWEAFINPFSLVLIFIAGVSSFTDIISPFLSGKREEINPMTVVIIITLIIISGLMKFFQELKSGDAAASLMAMVKSSVTAEREGKGKIQLTTDELVVGDIFYISAGDLIPADARIIESKSLIISQASLTGESVQLERNELEADKHYDSLTERPNLVFMGGNVVSGWAKAVVLEVGDHTMLGSIARTVNTASEKTSFERGINDVSWVLIKFMLVMMPLMFFINGFLKGDWLNSFIFAITVAVGMTPEMLPMIVTTCLSKGATSMSKSKTIIKDLSSIQNFGAMDILCTDKTGTLTKDKIILEVYLNARGEVDERALGHAFLNSYFQTGLHNAMDDAIITYTETKSEEVDELKKLKEKYSVIGEIPFDFKRRRLSVIVKSEKDPQMLITKGAVEEIISVCSHIETENGIELLSTKLKTKASLISDNLNKKGMRVVALAKKENLPPDKVSFDPKDESNMVLMGYLAFLDPPRESSEKALRTLKEHGVSTKILTGDNDKVTQAVCAKVGLDVSNLLLGSDIEKMNDAQLSEIVEKTNVCAKLSPDQKARVVEILKRNGHVVGFMGDGINDAAAIKKADIGISVDNAVDIAKDSADVILLEKDLMVLERGIIEGRKTYANMIKYIKITASSNFGNMFSVLAASALLPFMPMASLHLILLNLIYDFSSMAMPWDNVDKSFLKKPRSWEAKTISGFMIFNGPVSSLFDWITYAVLYFFICPIFTGGALYNQIEPGTIIGNGIFGGLDARTLYVTMFQSGWFIECLWTQMIILFVMRTSETPIIKSRPSKTVTLITIGMSAITTLIPFTFLGSFFNMVPLPFSYFGWLAGILAGYVAFASIIKAIYIKIKKTWL